MAFQKRNKAERVEVRDETGDFKVIGKQCTCQTKQATAASAPCPIHS